MSYFRKAPFSKHFPSTLKKRLRFVDGLVWTVGLNGERNFSNFSDVGYTGLNVNRFFYWPRE